MEATVSLELGQRGGFKSLKEDLEPSDEVFLHEKTQKLFKYARTKDKQEELKKELQEVKDKEQRRELCQKEDERHNTALHYAAKAGNLETCQFLVEQGADIKALGQNKMSPLQFAARYGDEKKGKEVWKCIEWIMEEEEKKKSDGNIGQKEKEIFFDGRDDFSILHHAIQNKNWVEDSVVVWELIKTRKFKISDPDKQGNTSLHLAAQFNRQDNHTLLENFLPPYEEKDSNGQDYIDKKDLEKCLKTENKVGMTPLHVACAVGNPDSVKQLLEVADIAESINVSSIINSPDSNRSLPLSLAITSKNLKMVEILMEKGAKVDHNSIITAARSVL